MRRAAAGRAPSLGLGRGRAAVPAARRFAPPGPRRVQPWHGHTGGARPPSTEPARPGRGQGAAQ
eukprot:754059-Hanusia_phi.AAC.7